MRTVLFTVALLLLAGNVLATEFCDGFEAGYKTGYKQAANF